MQSSELAQFTAQVTKHYELYPAAHMSQATVSAWWDELVDIPLPSVIFALERSRQAGIDVDNRSGQPVVPACSRVKALANMHAQQSFDASRRQKLIAQESRRDGCTLDPENPWMQTAAYWEQENEHWQQYPNQRPEDPGKQRWVMWHKTEKLADEWRAKRDASASSSQQKRAAAGREQSLMPAAGVRVNASAGDDGVAT